MTADPASLDATFREGVTLHQQGDLPRAEALYRDVLRENPRHFNALHLLGVIAIQSGRPDRGLDLIGKAIALRPDAGDPHNNLGNALARLDRDAEALASYDRAIALKADFAEAHNNRGTVLRRLKRPREAIEAYDRAIALRPDYADALNGRGLALVETGRSAEAIASFERATTARPGHAEAWFNLGNALKGQRRLEEALACFDRAVAADPAMPQAFNNRGTTLDELNRSAESIESYDRAIALKPDYANAHYNRGAALKSLRRFDEALESHATALRLDPKYPYLRGNVLNTRMRACDWTDFDEEVALLLRDVAAGERATPPFFMVAIPAGPDMQKRAARTWIEAMFPNYRDVTYPGRLPRHERIRIGYYSADLHDHATAYLMAEFFEQHDRDRFEISAFSFGPDRDDPMRHRLVAAFDHFHEVSTRSDMDIVKLSREQEIDIAVDLKGYTKDSRTPIIAGRPAPIQVNYLGYPATMGADFIDYLIADPVLIPETDRRHYVEKIVYLPETYQVNDRQRRISDRSFSRADLGLPRDGFVFCCFNNNYKITPDLFDVWMRILQGVEDSVLWLFQDSPQAAANLRREAAIRGVDPGRLIFARRMPLADHLARHRLADLFLDTVPCNAHTTASDALWAGLPVLTILGKTFAGRVAASLLTAIGLPELIAETPADYEAMAIDLATHPRRLAEIESRLTDNRLTTPLFDSVRLTRHIEAAYTAMYERYQAGLAPTHIHVEPLPIGVEAEER